MRIVYQSGKLYLSLREEEKKDIVESYPKPCEIDLSLIPVLNKDLSNINEQIWKDTTAKEYQGLVGTISKK